MSEFVLDMESNPHPVMRDKALNLRRLARQAPGEPLVFLPWQGYRECMVDATGCTPEEIEAWLDRHDPLPDPSAFLAVTKDHATANVELRARKRK